MQKVFIAVVLALALCSATAKYTVNTAGFVKAPVAICNNNTDCLNATNLVLGGMSKDDVSIMSWNAPTVDKNASSASWKLFTAKLNSKDLSSSGNATYSFSAPSDSQVVNGYALLVGSEMGSDNITNLYLYQTKLEGAVALPRVKLTTNTDKNFTPTYESFNIVGNTIVGAAVVADKKLNISSITLGGSALGKEFTLSTGYTGSFNMAIGGALGSSVLALWREGDALKQAVYDFSKNTATPGAVGGYNSSTHTVCEPFATDKKYYGVICSGVFNKTLPTYIAVLNNNSALASFPADLSTSNNLAMALPYAGFIAVLSVDLNETSGSLQLFKSIWNLDTSAAELKATLMYTGEGLPSFYRVPNAGAYMLLSNRDNNTVPRTDAVVGQILSGSYLTTVFGFLMTIVAGLLLF